MNKPKSASGKKNPTWLEEKVYRPKRQRTLECVVKAVDSLVEASEGVSLRSVCARSKTLDPAGRGVSESALLHHPEAHAYYVRHRSWRGHLSVARHKQSGKPLTQEQVTIRRRHERKTKSELIQELLDLQQAHGVMHQKWLEAQDQLLTLQLARRKFAGIIPHPPGRK